MLILLFRRFLTLTNSFTVQRRISRGRINYRVEGRFEREEVCLEIVQDVHFLSVKSFFFPSSLTYLL